MTGDLRWATRYAFSDELWRGRARIVLDSRLEAALARTSPSSVPEVEAGAALFDDLVPRVAQRRDTGDDARLDVWMGVTDEATGRRLAPRRPGTQFLGLSALCETIRRRRWEVALVDLTDLLVPGEDGRARLSVRGSEVVAALASRPASDGHGIVLSVRADPDTGGLDYDDLLQLLPRLAPELADSRARIYGVYAPPIAAVVELSEEADGGEPDPSETTTLEDDGGADRTAQLVRPRVEADEHAKTLSVRVPPREGAADAPAPRRGTGSWRGRGEDVTPEPRDSRATAGELLVDGSFERTLPGAGSAPPVEDGAPSSALGVDGDAAEGPDDAGVDEEVPLSFDNTLGSRAPRITEYIVVLGPQAPEGMTLVELPERLEGDAADGASDSTSAGVLRAQLVSARRHADLAALERQTLLERVDELESQHRSTTREMSELRDRLARALAEGDDAPTIVGRSAADRSEADNSEDAAIGGASDRAARLDAAQAELQTLRWRLAQAEHALDEARARPVDALEAELAATRARLAMAQAPQPADDPAAPTAHIGAAPQPEGRDGERVRELWQEGGHPASLLDPRQAATLLASLQRLLARVERGGLPALELRRRLLELRAGVSRLSR